MSPPLATLVIHSVADTTGVTVDLSPAAQNALNGRVGAYVKYIRVNLYSASPPVQDGAASTAPPLGIYVRLSPGRSSSNSLLTHTGLQLTRPGFVFLPLQWQFNAAGAGAALNAGEQVFSGKGLYVGDLAMMQGDETLPRDVTLYTYTEAGAPLTTSKLSMMFSFYSGQD